MATRTNYLDRFNIQDQFDTAIDDPWYHFNTYNLSEQDLINLAGGIPCEEIGHCKVVIDTYKGGIISVDVYTPEFKVIRQLDFSDMTIHNVNMRVRETGKGLGLNLLVNQIIEARRFGFNKMEVVAAGGSDYGYDPDFNGYYTWGKAGYLMDEDSQQNFKGWLYEKPFNVTYLHELLETEFGCKIWKTLGCSWRGYFDLKDGSKSLDILQKYLLKRGIKKHF